MHLLPPTDRFEHGGVLQGHRVLIVEDEYVVVEALRTTLIELGAFVLEPVSRAGDAVRLALAERPTVVLVVLILSGSDPSYTLADTLADLRVPIVFVTGASPERTPQRHRAVPWVAKPATRDRIVPAILRAVRPVAQK